MDDGIQLLIGGGTAGALITMLGNYLISKTTRKSQIEPQPLEVKGADRFVKCEECIEHRRIIEARHNELAEEVRSERKAIAESLSTIRKDIIESDRKAEERSRNLHKRLDPIVETVGSLTGRFADHVAIAHHQH